MINWDQLGIKIDPQASIQIEHYFNDLENILNNQNLLYKKNEVFKELENHIIDIIRDKQILKISYAESLQILTVSSVNHLSAFLRGNVFIQNCNLIS